MRRHGLLLDRSFVAKLSDAREQLHALSERARTERRDEAAAFVWPRDINAPEQSTEARRG